MQFVATVPPSAWVLAVSVGVGFAIGVAIARLHLARPEQTRVPHEDLARKIRRAAVLLVAYAALFSVVVSVIRPSMIGPQTDAPALVLALGLFFREGMWPLLLVATGTVAVAFVARGWAPPTEADQPPLAMTSASDSPRSSPSEGASSTDGRVHTGSAKSNH